MLAIIRKLLEKCLPKCIYKKIEFFYCYIMSEHFRKYGIREKSYGRLNKDKTFYVLGENNEAWGILSTWIWYFNSIEWAINQGYIPIVDLKKYYMPLSQDKKKMHKENAWEYYFEQPYPEYSLEEVYKSKHVFLGWKNTAFPHNKDWIHEMLTPDEIERWSPIAQKYIKFQPAIRERAENFWKENVGNPPKGKVLAVCMRASFKRAEMLNISLYNKHPRSKSLEQWLLETEEHMAKWGCKYVFVSVEDREWLEAFRNRFGNDCLTLERPLVRIFREGNPVPVEENEYILQEYENVSIRKKTEDYLVEVCIISMCDCLLAQKGSAQTVASLYNGNKYEHQQIYFDLMTI